MTPEELRAMRRGEKPQLFQQQPQLTDGTGGGGMQPMSEQQMMAMEQAYNPMMNMGGSPDIRRVDRWLEYKVPSPDDIDKYWMTETQLAEELAKGNYTKEEYNWFVREYYEIEAIGGGDGNEKWKQSRQRKFLLKVMMTRGRSDNKEVGLRDGTLLMTQNINQKSDVKMPQENGGQRTGGGFFGFFGGGNK